MGSQCARGGRPGARAYRPFVYVCLCPLPAAPARMLHTPSSHVRHACTSGAWKHTYARFPRRPSRVFVPRACLLYPRCSSPRSLLPSSCVWVWVAWDVLTRPCCSPVLRAFYPCPSVPAAAPPPPPPRPRRPSSATGWTVWRMRGTGTPYGAPASSDASRAKTQYATTKPRRATKRGLRVYRYDLALMASTTWSYGWAGLPTPCACVSACMASGYCGPVAADVRRLPLV